MCHKAAGLHYETGFLNQQSIALKAIGTIAAVLLLHTNEFLGLFLFRTNFIYSRIY